MPSALAPLPPTPPADGAAAARARRAGLGVQGRLVLLVVAAVLPFLALTAWRAQHRAAAARAALAAQAGAAAQAVAGRLDERAENVRTLLAAVAPQLRAGADSAGVAANDALLLAVKQTLPAPQVTNLWAYAPDGANVGTSARPRPARAAVDIADRPYFREAIAARALAVAGVVRGRPDSTKWSVPFAYPVVDAVTDEVRLVVVGSVHARALAPLARPAGLPAGSRVLVRDAAGRVIAAWPDDAALVGRPAPPAAQGALTRSARAAAPWAVRVEVPGRVAYAAARAELARDLALGALTLALALGLALLAARRITRPVRALVADAEALAAGRRPAAGSVTGPGELGVLARAFDHMAATIADRTAALHTSEQRYRLLFEACPLPTYLVDVGTFAFLAVNDAAVAQYGYTREEFARLTLVDLRPAEDRLLFLAAARPGPGQARGGDPARLEAGVWRHLRRDGRVFDVEVYTALTEYEGRPARLSVAVDVTARRAAERALRESQEQLRRAQKMEALGRFAGGIAHDFNNLLTGILGAADLALGDLPEDSDTRGDVEMIRDAARRAAALTGQILAFSRGGVVQPSLLRVAEVVDGLAPLLDRVIGEHIRLVVQAPATPDPAGGHVTADRGQLEQVVMNLVLNAHDAMPDGGTLVVRTDDVALDAESPDHPGVPVGNWVQLVVRDTGVGMDEATQARIFEPFFTTKARGKGTGLGLATVYGIVTQAGGVVRVASARDVGSTFALYWPRADVDAAPARRSTPGGGMPAVATPSSGMPALTGSLAPSPSVDRGVDRGAAPRFAGGGETVLLVEDEQSVRTIARAALTRRGYRVLTAAEGAEALAIVRAYPGPIALLLTDVVMPGIGGRELAEQVAAERPGVRVLFMSGYTEDEVLHRGVSTEAMAFLPKPFTPEGLASRVRQVLDAPVAVGRS